MNAAASVNSSGGASKGRQLQWAAFVGNCEHEVAPVTTGYRCTLTYNLYLLSKQVDCTTSSDCTNGSTVFQQTNSPSTATVPLDRRSVLELGGTATTLLCLIYLNG